MDRARGDGAGGIRVVVGGADRHDPVAVAVGGLEDGAGDVGPGPDRAGAGAVVGAVGGAHPQHVEDGLWIGNTYLDDSGRDSPASLNSTGDM